MAARLPLIVVFLAFLAAHGVFHGLATSQQNVFAAVQAVRATLPHQ
jgi:hypothetical protein